MKGDDWFGIIISAQHHDKETNLKNSILHVGEIKKSVKNLEKTIESFTNMKQKCNVRIYFEC